ncbi:YhbY family RNA-binding protein [Advenella sp. WQ 585]|uniref:YhbY family RNA-binding protein n=1 Tax=Advenella mandrilli TaxID=2800330 RepID=A0ABS1E7X1_9BURK|nr:YhbY family RNA-binding protein [Advenella mandrilli]MBK1779627.1 YhbY family RNA-binding protein [Advenella mandrilli]
MPTLELTSKERSALRSAAHPLKPVVLIGDNGLTEAVLKEIDISLTVHGLIKVRVAGDDRQARIDMLNHICDTLSCANIHHLGKTLILYRHGSSNRTFEENEAEQQQPSYRKPSDPYTPKKMAAAGKSIKDKRRKTAIKGNDALASDSKKPARNPMSKPAVSRPAHNIPRRAGSALSLRAGRRSSTTRRGS